MTWSARCSGSPRVSRSAIRDPVITGHSIEFRINAEDAGRGFMPAPGTLTAWRAPSGPGVRVDEGYLSGMTVPGSFDSLVAKIIVTGADRAQALARSRRALAELVVEGMPTVAPFHRAVLDRSGLHRGGRPLRCTHALDRDRVRRRDTPVRAVRRLKAPNRSSGPRWSSRSTASAWRLWSPPGWGRPTAASRRPGAEKPVRRGGGAGSAKAPSGDALTSPMQGTIVKVAVADGDTSRPATWWWCWRR